MKLIYEKPEMKIREYKLPADGLITTSLDPDDYDLDSGIKTNSIFSD